MIKISEELLAKFNANPLYSKDGQGINAEVIAKLEEIIDTLKNDEE